MKKIALIIPNNIEKCPYVQYYINILEKYNIEYEIIEWCREKSNSKNIIFFSGIQFENKIYRLYLYLKYIKFIKKSIQNRKYDKIIVFTAQLGILLKNFLIEKYRNNYIVDIRDYNSFIKYRKKYFYEILKNSYSNVISSPGFKNWLPKESEYIISHNLNSSLLNIKIENNLNIDFLPKILTIGMIRDLAQQEKFIEKYNEKYILEYRGIGKNIEFLKQKYQNLKNLKFYGKYKKEDEIEFYLKSDFINLIVGDDLNSKTLLANRFYNALITNKYMIASKGSYMGEIVKKYELGFIFEEEFSKEKISQLKYKKELLIEKIRNDQKKFEENLIEFIYEEKYEEDI